MSDMRIVVDVKFEEVCGTYSVRANNTTKIFGVRPREYWMDENRPRSVDLVIYQAVIEAWQAANSAVEK